MGKLVVLLAVSTVLAYFSQQNTVLCYQTGTRYRPSRDWAYVLLVTILVFFSGMRYDYNDTWNYISQFRSAPSLLECLRSETVRNVFSYPLFHLLISGFKSLYNNEYAFLFVTSCFTQCCFIWFIKRYSTNFVFSIFLYFTLGTFCFTLAALKQVLAMSVLMLAMPALERKQWLLYYFLVFIAMTLHTYALAFAVLPLFRFRPWSFRTVVFLGAVVFSFLNFESVIASFLDSAEDVGKTIYSEDLLNNTSLNLLRVLVYSATPLATFLFRRWLFRDSRSVHNILTHMSLISFAFMLMGIRNGANMFARMGSYFEMGTICILPWIFPKSLEPRSLRLANTLIAILFLGYFFYEFTFAKDFSSFKAFTLLEFFQRLF